MGGKPKGLELVGGRRILDRVADALRGATDAVILVANDPGADQWLPGVRVVPDLRPGHGPASGVHAALMATGTDVLVLAWDAPFVPAGLLRELRAAGESHHAGFVPPTSDSPWGFEPLCAWYANHATSAVQSVLDTPGAGIGAMAGVVPTVRHDASSWGARDVIFLNVNTPDDLERANAIARDTR
jgi:molybdopterin-guanine dinucleotide biosynthesis protein A